MHIYSVCVYVYIYVRIYKVRVGTRCLGYGVAGLVFCSFRV